MYVLPADVIRISPASAADSGNNATLAQFGDEYPGPPDQHQSDERAQERLRRCEPHDVLHQRSDLPDAKGAKYAGQAAKVTYAYWTHVRSEEARRSRRTPRRSSSRRTCASRWLRARRA